MASRHPTLLEKTRQELFDDKKPASFWQKLGEHNRDHQGTNVLFDLLGKLANNPSARTLAGGIVKMPDDYKLGPLAIFMILGLCASLVGVVLFILNWKNQNFPNQSIVTASGPMPMGQEFEVEPITTYTLPDSVQEFDWWLGENQERYECEGGISFRVETTGTLIIDNFTGKNITVQTPESFPGQITITCPKAGRLGFSQSTNIAPPALVEPTKQAPPSEESPATTQNEQSTPLNLVPVPAPVSGQYFIASVVHGGVISGGYWSPITTTGDYYSLLKTGSCGVNVDLPTNEEVYALVDVSLQMYGPAITATETSINIACDGYNSTIIFAVRVK